jgi:two-component system sensor histidine kinase YesM
MMKPWRFQSIHSNITLAFVLLILLTALTLSFISYHLSEEAVQENARTYTNEIMKQVNENIQTYVNGMVNISNLAENNRDLQAYLSKQTYASLTEEKGYEEKISEFFESILLSRSDIASVSVFGYNGQHIFGRKDAELNPHNDVVKMSWYTDAQAANGAHVLSPSHVQPIFKNEYRWVVSLSKELQSKDDNGHQRGLGVLLVDLNFSVMNDMFSGIDLGKRGYLFIVDEAGNIVYHPQQQLLYSNLKSERLEEVMAVRNGTFTTDEGKQSRMYSVQDSGFGWKIVGVSYVAELVGNKTEMRLSFLAMSAFCIVLALLLSIMISNRLAKPIKDLEGYMKEVERGNFDIQVPMGFTKEIGRLARAFNIMVGKIKELMSQTVRDQELKRKSELIALQAQINPHFLYNTLDSIIWMAESKRSEEVVIMTSALAKLFRSSISRGEELYTIGTETEHIENYLTIQKMRYQDKFTYQIRIDPLLYNYKTIKIVLQPIVENAIYHGIKNKRGPGSIEISSHEEEHSILLTVSDNGIGMAKEQLDQILSYNPLHPEGRGVGIRNVHERLQLYFGVQYGLTFDSAFGQGTTVTVRVPKVN